MGLLDGGVEPVDVSQGVKSGFRAEAKARLSSSLSMFWPHKTLLAGVALPRLRVPVMMVEAADEALSSAPADSSWREGEILLSLGSITISSSVLIGWKWESSLLCTCICALALNNLVLSSAKLTGVTRSVMSPISMRLMGYSRSGDAGGLGWTGAINISPLLR